MSFADLRHICTSAVPQHHNTPGMNLWGPESFQSRIYFIRRGSVGVRQVLHEQTSISSHLVSSGEFLAITRAKAREAKVSAQTTSPVWLCTVEEGKLGPNQFKSLHRLIEEEHLNSLMGSRQRERVSLDRLRQRLALFLLDIQATVVEAPPGGPEEQGIHLESDEVSRILGVGKQMVDRVLEEFVAQGSIVRAGLKCRILDPHPLQVLSGREEPIAVIPPPEPVPAPPPVQALPQAPPLEPPKVDPAPDEEKPGPKKDHPRKKKYINWFE